MKEAGDVVHTITCSEYGPALCFDYAFVYFRLSEACRNRFSLTVNQKGPLCQVGACQHTCGGRLPLSCAVSIGVYTHTRTHAHTKTCAGAHVHPDYVTALECRHMTKGEQAALNEPERRRALRRQRELC